TKTIELNTYATGTKLFSQKIIQRHYTKMQPDADAKHKDDVIDKPVKHFDATTLHEVGHSVEGKYMGMVMNPNGPWKKENRETVADLIGDELDCYSDFAESYDKAELKKYLVELLNGKDSPDPPAVKLGQTARVDDLAKHPAVARCKLI